MPIFVGASSSIIMRVVPFFWVFYNLSFFSCWSWAVGTFITFYPYRWAIIIASTFRSVLFSLWGLFSCQSPGFIHIGLVYLSLSIVRLRHYGSYVLFGLFQNKNKRKQALVILASVILASVSLATLIISSGGHVHIMLATLVLATFKFMALLNFGHIKNIFFFFGYDLVVTYKSYCLAALCWHVHNLRRRFPGYVRSFWPRYFGPRS